MSLEKAQNLVVELKANQEFSWPLVRTPLVEVKEKLTSDWLKQKW